MLPTLSLKPDFAETADRFESWWQCRNTGRPLMSFPVRPFREPVLPPVPGTLRDRWLNTEYAIARSEALLQAHHFPAESLPVLQPNLGPDLTATLFGCDLEFGEHTSWIQHRFSGPDDWDAFLTMPPDFGNPYWQTIRDRTRQALERGHGHYLVGLPDLHGAYDMLAGLRSPEGLCLDLLDAPGKVHAAGLHAADAYVQAYNRCYALLRDAGQGSTTWCTLWHDGPAYVSSCDFLGLVSGEAAEHFILPTLIRETAPTPRSIFHLDGPIAHRHLDLILSLDSVQAIQWVWGSGAGPATRWLDTYRRILESGRAAQVICDTAREAIELTAALGTEGVWLTIAEEMESEEAARDLIQAVERAARKNKP